MTNRRILRSGNTLRLLRLPAALQLIDIAVKMEASMLHKCGSNPDSPRIQGNTDLQVNFTMM